MKVANDNYQTQWERLFLLEDIERIALWALVREERNALIKKHGRYWK